MSMKRLSKAAAGLGLIAVLLAGGNANAQSSCNFPEGWAGVAAAAAAIEAVTVTVSEISNVNYLEDRLFIRFSLDNEMPCMANYRGGYCLKVVVKGVTHEKCVDDSPSMARGGFGEHITVGPITGLLVSTTAYARVSYFGPRNYTPWSSAYTSPIVNYHRRGP